MRTTNAAWDTERASVELHIAIFIRVAPVGGGSVITVTEHDFDLTVDVGFGAETFSAFLGMTRSEIDMTADMSSDDLKIEGFLHANGITENDVRAGVYDDADVRVGYFIWDNLAAGPLKMYRGTVGKVTTRSGFAAEIKSLIDAAGQTVNRLTTRFCDTEFMNQGPTLPFCGVVEAPTDWAATTAYTNDDPRDATKRDTVSPTTANDRVYKVKEGAGGTSGGTEPASWNSSLGGETSDGTVTWITERARKIACTVATVTSRREITVTPVVATDAPDDFFGLLRYTSGNNSGQVIEVTSWVLSTKTVKLIGDLPFDPVAAETLDLVARCDKSADGTFGCSFYSNNERFVGQPKMPTEQDLIGLTRQ
jgi:hypothetical protein